jgi:hypothetical protein
VLCATGCRQVLGIDQPVHAGGDSGVADGLGEGRVADTPAVVLDAPSSVGFVQGGSSAAAGVTSSITFAGPEAAGDLNVVAVSLANTSAIVISVTDSDGNTYAHIDSNTANNVGTLDVYLATNTRQGNATNTITLHYSASVTAIVVAAEYRGVVLTSPVDVSAHGTGSGTILDSGALATTQAHDLILGIAAAEHPLSAGPGLTLHVTGGGGLDLIEDHEVTSTGSYHATATANAAGVWLIDGFALKAAN